MVITEMDKGKEKLLAVAWTYLYSVGPLAYRKGEESEEEGDGEETD